MYNFKISDEAFPYLVVQKGHLWHLKDDRAAWEAAYNQSLENTINTITPFLPDNCGEILDVGSGLGGIDTLIARRNFLRHGVYSGVTLLDGENDLPEVSLHSKTFNHMAVAERFQNVNGVTDFRYVAPELNHGKGIMPAYYDLIVSFGAWCFHFPPSLYLNYVISHCKKGTVLILDVRNNKPEWLMHLQAALGPSTVIRESAKFTKHRFVYA